ncbi:MAG: DUF4372 domain-containing protein [Bacteroidia bacterium]|nr:DUF4372 domain-containing protein [Bacteroidia bacterium]
MANVTLFSQIISVLDKAKLHQLVTTHNSNKYQKGYDSWAGLCFCFCRIYSTTIRLRKQARTTQQQGTFAIKTTKNQL